MVIVQTAQATFSKIIEQDRVFEINRAVGIAAIGSLQSHARVAFADRSLILMLAIIASQRLVETEEIGAGIARRIENRLHFGDHLIFDLADIAIQLLHLDGGILGIVTSAANAVVIDRKVPINLFQLARIDKTGLIKRRLVRHSRWQRRGVDMDRLCLGP